jgi:tetratricopeptide (TPR) repeat protein
MSRRGVAAILPLLLGLAVSGCTTAFSRGEIALGAGRHDEAAQHFGEAVASDPDHHAALAGLGVALYKTGDLDGAIAALEQVVQAAPSIPSARLYLGLAYLRRGEDRRAQAQLEAFVALEPHARLAAQVERALGLIHLGALSGPVREFVAASLDDEAEWERDVRRAIRSASGFVRRPVDSTSRDRGGVSWPCVRPRTIGDPAAPPALPPRSPRGADSP